MQSVAYTYDQGRDFIKAMEIARYHNLTFIGPTTGIMGVYHGAWWYYVGAVIFLLTGGTPIAFYWSMFIIHAVSLVFILYFLRKHTSASTAVFIGLLLATSYYFIFASVFAGNNIMVLPALLAFGLLNSAVFLSNHPLKKPEFIAGGIGISLALVGEFEFAFGMFIVPSYILAVILFPTLRSFIFSKKNLATFLGVFILIYLPRILFELKNGFAQSKILLSFFLTPSYHTPRTFQSILHDRTEMFHYFYTQLFFNSTLQTITTIVIIIASLILLAKHRHIPQPILFLAFMIASLFGLSLFYKDSFWGNYYEGLHYLFILLIAFILSPRAIGKGASRVSSTILICTLLVIFIPRAQSFAQQPKKYEGLVLHQDIVKSILKETDTSKPFCVQIYTPPKVPYTYEYLFTIERYQGRAGNTPNTIWVDDGCWFILEQDDYKERKEQWVAEHIPAKSTVKKSYTKGTIDIRYITTTK